MSLIDEFQVVLMDACFLSEICIQLLFRAQTVTHGDALFEVGGLDPPMIQILG